MRILKKVLIVLVILFLVFLTYAFLPLDSRLHLLGLEENDNGYELIVEGTQYEIIVNDNSISKIVVKDNMLSQNTFVTLEFYNENSSSVKVIDPNTFEELCTYNILEDSFDCFGIFLTLNETSLRNSIRYHEIIITTMNFWKYLPQNQR